MSIQADLQTILTLVELYPAKFKQQFIKSGLKDASSGDFYDLKQLKLTKQAKALKATAMKPGKVTREELVRRVREKR